MSAWLLRGACLLALAADGCIVREPGTNVEVTALSHASEAQRASLTNDQGYHVQLNQLYIVLSRVELVPCPGAQHVSVWRELFGPSIAHAHGMNTATAWSVPNVLAPLVDSTPIAIAALHPPAISYCGLRVSLEAADRDAERMPADVDLAGLSMMITGSYRLNVDGSAGIPFRYISIVSSTMELPFIDSLGNPTPVTFSEDNLNVTLQIEISYQKLFDGLALFPGAFGDFGDVVLSQILDHAAAVVVQDAG